MTARLYLIPGLGSCRLTSLTVPMVQQFLNQRLEKGDSVRKVQVIRTVLSAALSRAVREEFRQWLQWGSLRSWERTFSQVELRGLEPLNPCLQNRRRLSDVVAHLGIRSRVRPLESGLVGSCCGQVWWSALAAPADDRHPA
jgi:hypothetical protein